VKWPMPISASLPIPNKPVAFTTIGRRRRTRTEILGIRNDNTHDATTNDNTNISLLELDHMNLNVSAGGEFYERAKSRRQRHRQVLMARVAEDTMIPLGRTTTGKRRSNHTTTSDDNDRVEQEYEQKGKLRALQLHDKMRLSSRRTVAAPPRGARRGAPSKKNRENIIEMPVWKPKTTVTTGKRRRAN
jgi:hypothetical protein